MQFQIHNSYKFCISRKLRHFIWVLIQLEFSEVTKLSIFYFNLLPFDAWISPLPPKKIKIKITMPLLWIRYPNVEGIEDIWTESYISDCLFCCICSLRNMFNSFQFKENLIYFQQLLGEGVFDISLLGAKPEEWKTLERLALSNLSKSKWVEHYNFLKVCTGLFLSKYVKIYI